jgi:hypothetical protein
MGYPVIGLQFYAIANVRINNGILFILTIIKCYGVQMLLELSTFFIIFAKE